MNKQKEIGRLHELFELASDNAGIGVFYYDLIDHPGYFYAQDKVMELLGLEVHENKLYTDDVWLKFMKQLKDQELVKNIFDQFARTWSGDNKLYSVEYPSYAFNPPKWLAAKAKVTKYDVDGKALNMIGILIDITEQKAQKDLIEKQKRELEILAFKDQLTGLNNRLSFYNFIEKEKASLVFIDLDEFKQINDTYGHRVGDEFLKAIGEILLDFAQKSSCNVYRLAGDEFILSADKNLSKTKIVDITMQLMKLLSKVIQVKELKLSTTASVGVCIYKGQANMKDVLHQADIAMYLAKKNGKNQYIVAK